MAEPQAIGKNVDSMKDMLWNGPIQLLNKNASINKEIV